MINRNVKKLIFTIFFLSSRIDLHAGNQQYPDHIRYADAITKRFAEEMEKEFNLQCIGSGGSMPYDVEKIEVTFSALRRASIEEARVLAVKTAEKLIQAINADEKVRPFLREYPFKAGRASISIDFDTYKNDHYYDGTVAHVLVYGRAPLFSENPMIAYCRKDPISLNNVDLKHEPYEEALKIVQESEQSRQDWRFHQPTPYEAHLDQLFIDFEKKARKQWGLIAIAEGGNLANGIEEIGINFADPHRASIERARELQVQVTEQLLELINNDPFLQPYLEEYPFPLSKTKVSISFKKRNNKHYTDGSVAIVHQADNKVFYLTMEPNTKWRYPIAPIPLAEESYEEAKKQALGPKSPIRALSKKVNSK